jgi:cyclophilin family peptidyl-prolyl cis-trans isomerase
LKNYLYSTLILALLVSCSPAREEATTTAVTSETTASAAVETAAADTAATDTTTTSTTTDTAPPPAAEQEKKPMSQSTDKVAELHTTAGEIHIRFFPDVAPNHVKNFLDLAQKGFYNGTKFHRVIPGFMIQGGDPNTIKGDPGSWGMGGNGDNHLRAEFNSVPHKRGIVSMARANDPNSASSQFFIVVKDSNFLDNNYTVFGQVTKGMDVADKIVSAARGPNDRPNNPTAITSIKIRDAKADEKGPAPR